MARYYAVPGRMPVIHGLPASVLKLCLGPQTCFVGQAVNLKALLSTRWPDADYPTQCPPDFKGRRSLRQPCTTTRNPRFVGVVPCGRNLGPEVDSRLRPPRSTSNNNSVCSTSDLGIRIHLPAFLKGPTTRLANGRDPTLVPQPSRTSVVGYVAPVCRFGNASVPSRPTHEEDLERSGASEAVITPKFDDEPLRAPQRYR